MARLFGTDGVRGKAGEYPLDVPTVRRIGAALARTLRRGNEPVRFLAGRDTRESGGWIERELAFGIQSQGGNLTSAGIIPTPAIAYLTPRMAYTAGVVISASHNPFEDNGIKVFSGAGEKFTEALEAQVEAEIADHSWAVPAGEAVDVDQVDYRAEYIAHLRGRKSVDEVARMPIFRPLIGMDKQEIIKQAEAIDTFETSILPDEDCCTLFEPREPATRASAAELDAAEAGLLTIGTSLVGDGLARAAIGIERGRKALRELEEGIPTPSSRR